MKTLIVLLALAVASHAYMDCEYDDLEGFEWGSVSIKEPIDDNFSGTFLKLNATGFTDVKITNDQRSKYVDVSMKNDMIEFFTTDKYKDIEYELAQSNNPRISFVTTFYCEDGYSEISFSQPIKDINNHAPTFNRKLYTYKFGKGMGSVAKGFHLNELLDIIAVDIDLTDTKIDFSIDDKETLGVERLGYNSNKIFKAELTTLKELVAPMDKNFTITAKDPRDEVGTAIVNIILL